MDDNKNKKKKSPSPYSCSAYTLVDDGVDPRPAARLLAVIRARGSDATDVRDAAHEAHHALWAGCSKPWTRDNVHAALTKRFYKDCGRRSAEVRQEIEARAVEMLVCAELGVEYDLPHWAHVCWMETRKNGGIALPIGTWLQDAIANAAKTKPMKEAAKAVLALGQDLVVSKVDGAVNGRGSKTVRRV